MNLPNKPMMSDKEIKILDNMLLERKPKYCLELGSGISTIYFPTKHKFIRYWRSVEHNGHWYKDIRKKIADNTDMIWVRDDNEETYFAEALLYKYDFVLIDGLNRERAIKLLPLLLNKDGWALLHDAGRKEYQGFIKKHGGKIIINGEEPYEGYYKHRGFALFENVKI